MLWALSILSHLIFPTHQPRAEGTILISLLQVMKQTKVIELAQGHMAHE